MGKPGLTVGICAYNEEKNIGKLIPQILRQRLESAYLKEIIVVSSGSDDGTDEVVRKLAAKDPRIHLLIERERKGKTSAVNMILARARGNLVVLASADLQLGSRALENIAAKFTDWKIGMAGARPVPVNDPATLSGFCSKLLWEMHHQISLKCPKCGELVAFRNRYYSIPADVGADEAYLESRFIHDGFSLAYADDAIVRNRGPQTISDYIRQRRRVHAQHFHLRNKTGYSASTSRLAAKIRALASCVRLEPGWLVFAPIALALEGFSYAGGAFDYYIGRDRHVVWAIAKSTKEIG